MLYPFLKTAVGEHKTLIISLTIAKGYYHYQKRKSRMRKMRSGKPHIASLNERMIKSPQMNESLNGKTILITGAARRVGKVFALACACAGADVVIHHGHSDAEAEEVREQIVGLGRRAWVFKADLSDSSQTSNLIPSVNKSTLLYGLVNSAAIFGALSLENASPEDWQRHIAVNLTAPFLLSQAFAKQAQDGARIVNILDWRALRPGADHFPYTISKAALAAMTKSLAVTLAPKIIVNGLALGAILPPSDGRVKADIIKNVPAGRWAEEQEIEQALLFSLTCPAYITGEIVHLDGGRHLV
jgi:NAD(P)-dependent dehydrogenase (short-subunit alcohol dehydrogenase family)